ncbi:MAG: molybdenum cofactor guanylyltransferase [Verrucomicrobiales bacterium]
MKTNCVEKEMDEIITCILAGGASSRMGSDKRCLQLGGETFIEKIEGTVMEWRPDMPLQIIQEDVVERCGPLGGIITAFRQLGASNFLFLSCDMPFISVELLQLIMGAASREIDRALFCATNEGAGFPFYIPASAELKISETYRLGRYSLQFLTEQLGARLIYPALLGLPSVSLMNINTPEDFMAAREIFEKSNRR